MSGCLLPSPRAGFLCLFAACQGAVPVASDEIVVGIGSNPTNLDPRFAPDAFSDKIARLIFGTLVQRGDGGALGPGLAERWVWESPDVLRLHLRPGVRFHDGTAFDAADVEATLRSIQDPALASVKRQALDSLVAIEVIDELSIRLRLRRAEASFPGTLAGVGIAPSEALAGPIDRFRAELPGTGAFRFVEAVTDQHVLLERVQGAGPRWLRFRVIPDATVRVLELMHGGVDLLQNDLPAHVVERLRDEEDLRVETAPSNLVKYLVFNTSKAPLDSVEVRRALAAALDRGPIVRHRLRGLAVSASGFFLEGHWAHRGALPVPAFDPLGSERGFDAAGLTHPRSSEPRLKLVFRTSMDDNAVGVARLLRRQLAAVGVEVDVRPSEWGVFFSDIKQGAFDLFTITGVGIHDPDWLSFVAHSRSMPPAGANRARYRHEGLDALLDLGRVVPGQGERAAVYGLAQEILARDVPILPLWFEHNVVARRAGVEGYRLRADADFSGFVDVRREAVGR